MVSDPGRSASRALHGRRTVSVESPALAECGKPLIAMIRGFCIGGGLAIAIGCDIRIASADSKFGIPAARLGVGYGAPGVRKLVNLVRSIFVRQSTGILEAR